MSKKIEEKVACVTVTSLRDLYWEKETQAISYAYD